MSLFPTVCILMSTYNGEKYLEEQLQSIFEQENVDIYLVVRDDGSTDRTISILEKWKEKFIDKMSIIVGKNKGWQDSFLTLMYEVRDMNFLFYAFADQDDIWKKDKLYHAVQLLKKNDSEGPCLYYGNQTVVNEKLEPLYDIKEYKKWEGINRNRTLMNGGCLTLGCMMVWNKDLHMLATCANKSLLLGKMIAHDQWLGMVTVWLGKAIYEDYSGIFHRRHITSVTNSGKRKSLIRKICTKYPPYARVFYNCYCNKGFLCEEEDNYIKQVAFYRENILYKWKLLFDKRFRYPSILGTIKLKIAILLNRF